MDWELFASIAIIIVVGFAVFRSGQGNPVSTGDLERRFNELKNGVGKDIHKIRNDLQGLESRLQSAATKDDVEAVRLELKGTASAKELSEVSAKVQVVAKHIEGIEKAADRTEEAVQRIEAYFMRGGVKK